MKITIFFVIFTCELLAITTFILIKLATEIYEFKKANKNFEELMRASQDGIRVD